MPQVTKHGGEGHSGLHDRPNVGIVLDNVDPDELGRIKVKFPNQKGEPESFWIRQSSPMAGRERGLYALPEKEDEVIVMFMQGSQNVGVIVGQFWNGEDKPPTEAKDGLPGPDKTKIDGSSWSKDTFTDGSKDLAKNDRRFWKSRSGTLMVMDDSDGAESLQFWDKNHELSFVLDSTKSMITLANSKGDIHIRSKNDIYIEAGNDIKWIAKNNIEGESGVDTIHRAKANYKLKADENINTESGQNTTMEAGANFRAAAQANFDIEGMVVKSYARNNGTFESKGSTFVKGSKVAIN